MNGKVRNELEFYFALDAKSKELCRDLQLVQSLLQECKQPGEYQLLTLILRLTELRDSLSFILSAFDSYKIPESDETSKIKACFFVAHNSITLILIKSERLSKLKGKRSDTAQILLYREMAGKIEQILEEAASLRILIQAHIPKKSAKCLNILFLLLAAISPVWSNFVNLIGNSVSSHNRERKENMEKAGRFKTMGLEELRKLDSDISSIFFEHSNFNGLDSNEVCAILERSEGGDTNAISQPLEKLIDAASENEFGNSDQAQDALRNLQKCFVIGPNKLATNLNCTQAEFRGRVNVISNFFQSLRPP